MRGKKLKKNAIFFFDFKFYLLFKKCLLDLNVKRVAMRVLFLLKFVALFLGALAIVRLVKHLTKSRVIAMQRTPIHSIAHEDRRHTRVNHQHCLQHHNIADNGAQQTEQHPCVVCLARWHWIGGNNGGTCCGTNQKTNNSTYFNNIIFWNRLVRKKFSSFFFFFFLKKCFTN